MSKSASDLRQQARAIWQAAVDAARPEVLIPEAIAAANLPLAEALKFARRILVVGGGKAGAAMGIAVEHALAAYLDRIEGLVNVPAGELPNLRSIHLHVARPAGANQPTQEGVAGTRQMLKLVSHAGPQDVALCLLSGGGSALLPGPVEEISLADKQQVTQFLHACGASINEMNTVRKHLSSVKGGRLAQAFSGKALFSLILSDVVGDPLDVIASGPTAPDPTTFAEALAVLERYQLRHRVPASVTCYLERGVAGQIPETPKHLADSVHNLIIGNNARALEAAEAEARRLGYSVLNLGSYIEGETSAVAVVLAGLARSISADSRPLGPPVCLLCGGETTVTLTENHGLGGRNQEFVLAAVIKLGPEGLRDMVVLSGGTDGEDGPTDAAGALADADTWSRAAQRGFDPTSFLARHDSYHFFEATGDLLKTGLTQTNVMDVRVILIA